MSFISAQYGKLFGNRMKLFGELVTFRIHTSCQIVDQQRMLIPKQIAHLLTLMSTSPDSCHLTYEIFG